MFNNVPVHGENIQLHRSEFEAEMREQQVDLARIARRIVISRGIFTHVR
jgi:hypothetical protein